MATPEELAEEAKRARKVRQIVDITTSLVMQSNMTREEAEAFVAGLRERILALFPDGASAYELIYAPRFRRLIDEFTAPVSDGRRGVVIPFPRSGR